jgi:hypothetical protein
MAAAYYYIYIYIYIYIYMDTQLTKLAGLIRESAHIC